MLFFNEIYKEILNIEGVIMEFGIRWDRIFQYLSHSEVPTSLTILREKL